MIGKVKVISRKTWVLIERTGDGPMLEGGYDSLLREWPGWTGTLVCVLEEIHVGKPFDVRLTVLEMTDEEHVEYCREHEIDLDGDFR